jgi:predicted dehydrogenase
LVKAIQVGIGRWGSSWSKDVIPKVPTIELVAYVDANPAAIAAIQADLGVPPEKCFLSLAEAAKAVPADLVIATVRTVAHYPVVKQALELGFHVLVEKPFAATMAEARELVALAEAQNRTLMISQNYRFQPAPIAAARLVAEQKLGPVNLVSIDFRRHAPSQGYRSWDTPDPLLADMSIHHFDLMRMVLNDNPKRVSCRSWNPPSSPFHNPPIGVATVEFDKGTIVSYRGSWMSSGPTTPWSGEWTMDCSDGEIWWASRDHLMGKAGPDRLMTREPGAEPEVVALEPIPFADRAGTLASIASVIETGIIPTGFSSGRDNLKSFALVQATILSAGRSGDWVDIAEVMA